MWKVWKYVGLKAPTKSTSAARWASTKAFQRFKSLFMRIFSQVSFGSYETDLTLGFAKR